MPRLHAVHSMERPPLETKCSTLRLTEAQRDVVREATGRDIDIVTLPLDDLEKFSTGQHVLAERDEEAIVWECLNPYP